MASLAFIVKLIPEKIISGGQTGADRAALNWAITRGIPHGGWCPRGRLAEDGEIAKCYDLRETPELEYLQRTEWNVRDADATVIFSLAETLTSGSLTTAELAVAKGKPWLHLSATREGGIAAKRLHAFLQEQRPRVLNVAGPRASGEQEVGGFVQSTLEAALAVDKP